jgi:23S rRNA (cytidine1920-2'-O)/16S rRNA (cytidine1409-2'-O)-methyltransferase
MRRAVLRQREKNSAYMKERLDVLLVNNGYAASREKAKAIIMSGIVYVNGQKEDKAGSTFDAEAQIEVRGHTLKYVSRGGLKLEKAIAEFGIDPSGKICMDVGASTGGFTDCMLQNGAVKVYSVDVGHGQLDWKLRNDPRVVCMEKTNIRYVLPQDIPDRIALSSIDVSFISLSKVLPAVHELLEDEGEVAALIKPQFEAGREKVGKKGVVRDKAVHVEVIEACVGYASANGFEVLGITYSPIKGPEGNIEYLYHLRKLPAKPGEAEDAADASVQSGAAADVRDTASVSDADRQSGEADVTISHTAPQFSPEKIRALVDEAHEVLR